MVTRLTLLLLAVSLLSAAAVAADEQRLTLDEAIAATLKNNPDLRAARAAEREGAARVAEARAAYLPRVDLVESWQRGNNPVYVFGSLLSQRRFTEANFAIGALNHPDPVTNHRAAFSIDQPLFDTQRLSGMRAAGFGRQIASALDARGGSRPQARGHAGVRGRAPREHRAGGGRRGRRGRERGPGPRRTLAGRGHGHRGGRPVADGAPRADAGARNPGRERRGDRDAPS